MLREEEKQDENEREKEKVNGRGSKRKSRCERERVRKRDDLRISATISQCFLLNRVNKIKLYFWEKEISWPTFLFLINRTKCKFCSIPFRYNSLCCCWPQFPAEVLPL